MGHIFSFQSSGIPDSAVLVGFRGREAISELFTFRVFVTIPVDAGFVPADALWLKATISITRGDGAPHEIHGLVAKVSLLLMVEERGLYEVIVRPRIHHLGFSRHSRVFTDEKSPDVITWVIDEAGYGADVINRLHGKYSPDEHICQYKESDFHFISRWMEREGIHYFFSHDDGTDKLVLADTPSGNDKSGVAVRYHPVAGDDVSAGDSFRSFRGRTMTAPASVAIADYDPQKPSLEISERSNVSDVGIGELSVFGGRVLTPAEAKRVADIHAEELRTRATVFQGEGRFFGIRPGYTFELTDHPRGSYNTDYLCVALEHEGLLSGSTQQVRDIIGLSTTEVYRVRMTAIRGAVPFRPPRITQWPRVAGFEVATVSGPSASDYAQIDDAGRYLVRMHFDEGDTDDGHCSTRLRMMQPHAGNPEGFHFPLRAGTEVFITFIGGDPDRPVIAGAVPNAVTPSVVTSANGTHNVIHTGGDTHIECEDLQGKQHIDIETVPQNTYLHLGEPHDNHSHYIVKNTGGDCLFEIGSNQDIHVGGKLTEKVDGMVLETYDTSQDSEITGPQKTTVNQPVIEIYKSTQDTEVTGKVTETHKSLQLTVAVGDRFEDYTDKQNTDVKVAKVEIYGATQDKTVTGATTQTYTGPLITNVSGTTLHTVGGAVTQNHGSTMSVYASWNLTCPGDATVDAKTSWDFLGLTGLFNAGNTEWNKGKKTEVVGFYLSLIGIKMEGIGVGIAGNIVKVEGAGGVLSWTTCALSGFGIRLSCNALHKNARVFKKYG
ncbi:MAG TPA: type VI secretion system tip protein TssI/VgrG [Polyangium sp.]|nr:type VI secretion system tip protein TssI/VgrG [Polyangium sp.]